VIPYLQGVQRWQDTLVQVGIGRHPGSWIGPGYPEWFWSPVNVVVLRSFDQTILIDAGPGITSSWWPFDDFRGDTEKALLDVGVTAKDVDLVVLTHLDFDHAGGVLAGTWPSDLGLAFDRAMVVIHEDAVASARLADPDARLNVGTRLVDVLERAGALVSAVDGAEVADGVVLRSARGHRPGHVYVEVQGSDPFIHAADTFRHEQHVRHPEWDSSSDDDTDLALATRRRLMAEIADSGARVVTTHMSRPSPFRIVHDNDDLRLVEA
jgi:glyoxylase-like metal-dependent hydrolase (beta-lactamase superfamily II)